MNIDNVFSPSRCGWLLRKYVKENRNSHLMSVGVFVAVMMLLIAMINGLVCMNYSDPAKGIDGEIGFMLLAFTFNGCIIASVAFRQMWDSRSAASMLMIPASALEQCVVRWIIVVPVYIVWSLLCAVFADVIKYVIFNYILDGNAVMIPWMNVFGIGWPEQIVNIYIVLMLFVVTQSFYFLGSIVWRKNAFVKTFFVMGVLFMLYAIPSAIVADSYTNSGPISVVRSDVFTYVPFQMLMWLTVIINYTLTVMRLRESEIIHRW